MPYVLGVDGGQSSTLCLLADVTGRVLGHGTAGPANHIHEPGGETRCRSAVTSAVRRACIAAGLAGDTSALPPIMAAGFGMSGANARMEGVIRGAILADTLAVEPDYVTAHRGALAGRDGVMVIAGTGSVAYGRVGSGHDGEARTALVGGWGYLLGDEGSGYWVGVEALRAIVQAADGRGPATALRAAILAELGASSLAELRLMVYSGGVDRPAIARLSATVSAHADAGDTVSRSILQQASRHLALAAATAASRLALTQPAVALVGGLSRSQWVRGGFAEALIGLCPGAQVTPAAYPPAIGALMGAYAIAGIPIDPPRIVYDPALVK